jgi:hypothetical protein
LPRHRPARKTFVALFQETLRQAAERVVAAGVSVADA